MLRYVATTVTLGVVTVGICSESKARESQTAACHHRKQIADPPHQHNSSSTQRDNNTIMDYKQESERIANKVYELYKDTDWKLAKTNVSQFSLLLFIYLFKLTFKMFLSLFMFLHLIR